MDFNIPVSDQIKLKIQHHLMDISISLKFGNIKMFLSLGMEKLYQYKNLLEKSILM